MIELFANSGDPDQTPCSAASDLGLQCLPITLLGVSRLQWVYRRNTVQKYLRINQGPVVQSVVSLTSSLRVISLTVLADSRYNILIFFAEKMCYSHFFSKKFQHICVSLD